MFKNKPYLLQTSLNQQPQNSRNMSIFTSKKRVKAYLFILDVKDKCLRSYCAIKIIHRNTARNVLFLSYLVYTLRKLRRVCLDREGLCAGWCSTRLANIKYVVLIKTTNTSQQPTLASICVIPISPTHHVVFWNKETSLL